METHHRDEKQTNLGWPNICAMVLLVQPGLGLFSKWSKLVTDFRSAGSEFQSPLPFTERADWFPLKGPYDPQGNSKTHLEEILLSTTLHGPGQLPKLQHPYGLKVLVVPRAQQALITDPSHAGKCVPIGTWLNKNIMSPPYGEPFGADGAAIFTIMPFNCLLKQ